MIQRIQTLYLFIAFLALVSMFLLPSVSFSAQNGMSQMGGLSVAGVKTYYPIGLLIAQGFTALLIFVTIFLFKNRPLQIKICAISLLLSVIVIGGIFLFADKLEKQLLTRAVYEAGTYISLLPMICIVMASKAIRKDERLVKSADRLR